MRPESNEGSVFDRAIARGKQIHAQEQEQREQARKAKKEQQKAVENEHARAETIAQGLLEELQLYFGKLIEGGLSVKATVIKSMAFDVSWSHNGEPIASKKKYIEKKQREYYKKVVALRILIKSEDTTKVLRLIIVPSRKTQYNSNFFYQICKEFEHGKGNYSVDDCGSTTEECIKALDNKLVEYLAKIVANKLKKKKPKKSRK